MEWHALLDDELRDRAAASIDEIVASLPEPDDPSIDDPSLAGGAAGLAVLCDVLAHAGLDDGENARAFLELPSRLGLAVPQALRRPRRARRDHSPPRAAARAR